jgi:hypothetical protein
VETLGWTLATLLVLVGLVGTVVPLLPGPPLVFAGLLLAAWSDGFRHFGLPTVVLLSVLLLAAIAVDLLASALGARRLGAGPLAVVGALVGTLVGLFFALPGLLIGPLLGAALGEYWSRRDWRRAGRVGLATWLGLLLGGAVKLALTLSMLAVFALAYFV